MARAQGWYYTLTGVWPLVHGTSFQWLTGFKTNFWLAQTVGGLLVLLGTVLLLAARADRLTFEIRLVGAGSALILAVADIVCVPLPETTRVYWGEAIAEFICLACWSPWLRGDHAGPSGPAR